MWTIIVIFFGVVTTQLCHSNPIRTCFGCTCVWIEVDTTYASKQGLSLFLEPAIPTFP